ncbi:uncharacterized protein BDW47DRAFT_125263 [Aspergillus candidus]|uniref:Uncharacterized protein n=1 Tax=Aspergillus candidus TaxID=41067 RepID=A0A2I2FDN3_ASPCN|nr:hypothetical protein BDW47DRAFT_125263 [Aspergillus candidus]PLB38740.1 hypothetical protein BDW47DRAFT_125263 [Aspergillus candidus]
MRILSSVDSLLRKLTVLGLVFCASTTAINLQNFLPDPNPRYLVQSRPEPAESTAYTPIINYQPSGSATDPLAPSVGLETQETPIPTTTTTPGYTSPASKRSPQTATSVERNE